jgi:hypothetical protein
MRHTISACVVFAALTLGERPAHAQGRDALLNGAVIGAVVGAGAGVAFTHAVRDSDLVFSQYARGALIFRAIGAGAGLGVDALFYRAPLQVPGTALRPLSISPVVWRDVGGVIVNWSW